MINVHRLVFKLGTSAPSRRAAFAFFKFLRLLSLLRLSESPLVSGAAAIPLGLLNRALGDSPLRLEAYLRRNPPKKRDGGGSGRYRAFLNLASAPDAYRDPRFGVERYVAILELEKPGAEFQFVTGHRLMGLGRLDLARATFVDLADNRIEDLPMERRLQLLRDCGIVNFMLGRFDEADRYWGDAGLLRRLILGNDDALPYRILGGSWFAAIGHVAMIDYYLKFKKLFVATNQRVVAPVSLSSVAGFGLCDRFAQLGIKFVNPEEVTEDYDEWALENNRRPWRQLTLAERAALYDEFWEFEFPDGKVLGYTHAAARVQREWEVRNLPPLLAVNDEERRFIGTAMRALGLPEDAWYVCLHVREPGFHKHWNELYPSMRDAEVESYYAAVETVIAAGGWVLRMGDPSMKKLPPMRNVVDYAHSRHKTAIADILIPLGCRFFLGTNSGYATIPAIYGVPCAFSNWIPLGLPLWPSQDIVAPKLFFDESNNRYLTIDEIFSSGAAWMQNVTDLPPHLKLVENSEQDIRDLALEMLAATEGGGMKSPVDSAVDMARRHYRAVAEQCGSYCGSRLSASFINNHPDVFMPPHTPAVVEPHHAGTVQTTF